MLYKYFGYFGFMIIKHLKIVEHPPRKIMLDKIVNAALLHIGTPLVYFVHYSILHFLNNQKIDKNWLKTKQI